MLKGALKVFPFNFITSKLLYPVVI